MSHLPKIAHQWLAALAVTALIAGCAPPAEETPADEPVAVLDETGEMATEAADEMVEVAEPEPEAEPETPAPAEEAEEEIDRSIQSAEAFGDDALLEGLTPDGYTQAGDIEHYNVAALYDKIDGRSELYMSYDVIGLSWVSFKHNDDPNDFIDVFVYDMRATTTAFGIYSVEREIGQPKVDIGREGYTSDSNVYFWKGKYYAYIQASKDTEQSEAAADGIAREIASRLDDPGDEIIGLDRVPTDGMVEDSIQYFRTDAMSLDFMTDTFIARYGTEDDYVTAFMSTRDTTEDAADIVEKYKGYLTDYGDNVETVDVDGTPVTIGDLGGGYYDAIFHLENTVAGVSAIEGKDATLAAAKAEMERLQAR